MKARLFLCVLGLAALTAGCSKKLTEAECAEMLDHYAETLIEQAHPSAKPSQRVKWVNEARLKAARDPEFAECPSRVGRSQYECAIAAPTADDVERCLL